MGWMGTASGKRVDYLDPRPDQIEIEDIATGLANVCRFAGQTETHYSVAQHCLLASFLAPKGLELAALLHDASEAYTGDCPRPLKRDLGEAWTAIESGLMAAILQRFGLAPELPAAIKTVDNRLLITERNQFQPQGPSWAGSWLDGVEPYPIAIKPLTPAEAKAAFLERFAELNVLPFPQAAELEAATPICTPVVEPPQLVDSVKESNPKDAVGCKKVPLTTLPLPVLGECAVGMLEGACKYGRHNYREIGVRASTYIDAAVMRHIFPYWEGEDIDPDSGLPHISKAITALMVLRDAQIRGKCYDDRPRKTLGWVKALNEKTGEVLARFPNLLPPYLAEGKADAYTLN